MKVYKTKRKGTHTYLYVAMHNVFFVKDVINFTVHSNTYDVYIRKGDVLDRRFDGDVIHNISTKNWELVDMDESELVKVD